jgi:hypothetical protein
MLISRLKGYNYEIKNNSCTINYVEFVLNMYIKSMNFYNIFYLKVFLELIIMKIQKFHFY